MSEILPSVLINLPAVDSPSKSQSTRATAGRSKDYEFYRITLLQSADTPEKGTANSVDESKPINNHRTTMRFIFSDAGPEQSVK